MHNSSSDFSNYYSNYHFTTSISYHLIHYNNNNYNGATNYCRTNYAGPNNRSTHDNYRNFNNNNNH